MGLGTVVNLVAFRREDHTGAPASSDNRADSGSLLAARNRAERSAVVRPANAGLSKPV